MISKRRFSLPRLDITGMWVFSLGVWFHIVARLVYSKPWMAFFLAELIAAILVLFGAYQVLDACIQHLVCAEQHKDGCNQLRQKKSHPGFAVNKTGDDMKPDTQGKYPHSRNIKPG